MASPAPPPSRREELLAKRARLLSEQAERTRQRERAEDLARFRRHMGAQLDAAGVVHELLWPEDERDAGPLQRYPIGFASVRWDLVPGVRQVPLDTGDGLRDQIRGVLEELGVRQQGEASWELRGNIFAFGCADLSEQFRKGGVRAVAPELSDLEVGGRRYRIAAPTRCEPRVARLQLDAR